MEIRAASQTCERTTPVPPLRVVVVVAVVLRKLIEDKMSHGAAHVNRGIGRAVSDTVSHPGD